MKVRSNSSCWTIIHFEKSFAFALKEFYQKSPTLTAYKINGTLTSMANDWCSWSSIMNGTLTSGVDAYSAADVLRMCVSSGSSRRCWTGSRPSSGSLQVRWGYSVALRAALPRVCPSGLQHSPPRWGNAMQSGREKN